VASVEIKSGRKWWEMGSNNMATKHLDYNSFTAVTCKSPSLHSCVLQPVFAMRGGSHLSPSTPSV